MEIEVLFEHDRHEVSWACIPWGQHFLTAEVFDLAEQRLPCVMSWPTRRNFWSFYQLNDLRPFLYVKDTARSRRISFDVSLLAFWFALVHLSLAHLFSEAKSSRSHPSQWPDVCVEKRCRLRDRFCPLEGFKRKWMLCKKSQTDVRKKAFITLWTPLGWWAGWVDITATYPASKPFIPEWFFLVLTSLGKAWEIFRCKQSSAEDTSKQ